MNRSARMIVRNNERRFLLMHTIKASRNRWEFPGGKINPGEKLVDTAVRECLEETGVLAKNPTYVTSKHIEIDDDLWIVSFYYSEDYEGVPTIVEPDKSDYVGFLELSAIDAVSQIPRLLIDIAREVAACHP